MPRVIEDPDLARLCEAMHIAAEHGAEHRPTMPAADSPAMAEISDQSAFSHALWELPIENAHSYGRFVTSLLLECFDSMSSVLERATVGPSFSPQILFRSILEATTVAHWLLEPGIGARSRATRGLVYRLDSVNQLGRNAFLDESIDGRSQASRSSVHVVCEANGWEVEANGIDGEKRPYSGNGFSAVAFGADAADQDFDRALWNTSSATAHVTFYAIADRIRRAESEDISQLDARVGLGAIVASSDSCIGTAISAFYGAVAAVQARDALFGFRPTDEEQRAWESIRDISRRRVAARTARGD